MEKCDYCGFEKQVLFAPVTPDLPKKCIGTKMCGECWRELIWGEM